MTCKMQAGKSRKEVQEGEIIMLAGTTRSKEGRKQSQQNHRDCLLFLPPAELPPMPELNSSNLNFIKFPAASTASTCSSCISALTPPPSLLPPEEVEEEGGDSEKESLRQTRCPREKVPRTNLGGADTRVCFARLGVGSGSCGPGR